MVAGLRVIDQIPWGLQGASLITCYVALELTTHSALLLVASIELDELRLVFALPAEVAAKLPTNLAPLADNQTGEPWSDGKCIAVVLLFWDGLSSLDLFDVEKAIFVFKWIFCFIIPRPV